MLIQWSSMFLFMPLHGGMYLHVLPCFSFSTDNDVFPLHVIAGNFHGRLVKSMGKHGLSWFVSISHVLELLVNERRGSFNTDARFFLDFKFQLMNFNFF